MKKKLVAKLVTFSFMTRVIVEEGTCDEDIVNLARPKIVAKVFNELNENLEEIVDDIECPFDEHDTKVETNVSMKVGDTEILGIDLKFEIEPDSSSFDFGTLTLQKDGRERKFDTSFNDYNHYAIAVNVFEGDDGVFDDCKQDLTEADLYDLDVAELFIGEEYDEEPESITLFVRSGSCTRAIDLKKD